MTHTITDLDHTHPPRSLSQNLLDLCTRVTWRSTSGVDDEGQMVVGFDTEQSRDGKPIRLVMSAYAARHLSESIRDMLDDYHHRLG